MKPHEERVIQEQQELDEKIIKLKAFISSAQFDVLDNSVKGLLWAQQGIMEAYRDILTARILIFKGR